jgi:opacity protein-like surface antigen
MVKHSLTFIGALSLAMLLAATAQAQLYVAGDLGATLPNNFSNISGTGGFAGNTLSDLRLKDAFAYVFRIGYFLPSVKWLGLETQVFNTNPRVKDQNIRINGVPAGVAPGSKLTVTGWAFNLVGRVPLGTFEPYMGAGPGIFFASSKGAFGIDGQDSQDKALGLNAFAGVRFFVTPSVAVFVEYKYDRAHFRFDNFVDNGFGVKGTYSANTISVGMWLDLSGLLHL